MPGRPDAEQSEHSDRNGDAHRSSTNAAVQFSELTGAAGSTVIPNSVLDDERLGPETRLVYVMLRRLAATGHGEPIGERELARRIGIPTHQIPRHLALLQRSGRIRIDGRPSARTPIRYWLDEPTVDDGGPSPRPRTIRPSRAPRGTAGLSLLDRLIVMGVDPQVAGRLVAGYPQERVAGALRAAHRRRPRPRDPAAWVVAAIRRGWVAQNASVAARERQAIQEQAIVAWEQRADAALAALPAETQQSLRRQASEVVERRFEQRLAATTIGAMLITAEMRRLVAEQAGIPLPDAVSPS